jgi:hypothetical protein
MAIGRIPGVNGIPESIIDAKGDLIAGTSADNAVRLAVGTNDQRLVAASGEAAGLKYVSDTQNTVVDAKGDLIVGTGADTVARLAVGTNGHTLVADSSETTGLKWQAATSGSMTSLASGNLSTSTTLSSISSAYEDLILILRNCRPATDGEGFRIRLNGNDTNVYASDITYAQTNAATFGSNFIQISGGIDNTATNSLIYLRFFDYANAASTWKFVQIFSICNNQTTSTTANIYNFGGISNITADINQIQVYLSAGNISGGTYELFGVK